MIAILLAAASAAVLLLGVGNYAASIPRGAPRSPVGIGVSMLMGCSLAVGALIWSWRAGGPSWPVIGLTAVPLVLSPLLLLLHVRRKVPTEAIRVREGERLLPFEALTPEGGRFHSGSLAGERVLLKFFRGEWCPFCQAELKRFDAMEPELRRYGVRVVAISKDAPEAARRHLARDGLGLSLLCDPELTVIRRYGLEHRKALEISAGPRMKVLGLSIGTRPAIRHMAAPATLLVDERGVIRWIDQTDDYKVRSSPERVLRALDEVFGDGTGVRHRDRPVGPAPEVDPLCEGC